MKKIFFAGMVLTMIVTALSAAVLMKTVYVGTKTQCHYSDGSVITLDGMQACDATN